MKRTPNISPYQPGDAAEWDRCVRDSEGACLLFQRGYMEYHADRFADASLTARLDGRLIGVFPASSGKDGVFSHGGLTFGGWQFALGSPAEIRRQVHAETLARYRHDGNAKLIIRALPGFFHDCGGAEEWWRPGLTGERALTGAAVDLSAPEKLGIKRRPCAVKALNTHEFAASSAEEFWPLLEEVLLARHGVAPTHSLSEMLLLQGRFPGQILTFKASQDQRILAGVMLFVSRDVAHVQYMATSLAGRASHALDGLLVWLMRAHVGRLRWFSMGTSNEKDGRINQGLLDYKLSFGAKPFAHDIREYDLTA